jgi:post-segregation antitoxin (ccd killing protein)
MAKIWSKIGVRGVKERAMSNVAVTIDLPEELVRRAREKGIGVEAFAGTVIAESLEAELKRRQAADELRDMVERLHNLPDNEKPTPEEIEAEIRLYRQTRKQTT